MELATWGPAVLGPYKAKGFLAVMNSYKENTATEQIADEIPQTSLPDGSCGHGVQQCWAPTGREAFLTVMNLRKDWS
jgi:hypothetical protein